MNYFLHSNSILLPTVAYLTAQEDQKHGTKMAIPPDFDAQAMSHLLLLMHSN